MLSLAAVSGIATVTISCYLATCILAGVLSQVRNQPPLPANIAERQLRTEIRDLISLILLDIVEHGEHPSASRVIERCPDHFKSGIAWEIWVQESHTMSMF